MRRLLHRLVLTLVVSTLLAGRCLPCANLLGSPAASGKSCCNKAGECQKAPSKDSSSRKPCPLQQTSIAKAEMGPQHISLQDVGTRTGLQISFVPPVLLEGYPLGDTFLAAYTPPRLYLLNSSFLI